MPAVFQRKALRGIAIAQIDSFKSKIRVCPKTQNDHTPEILIKSNGFGTNSKEKRFVEFEEIRRIHGPEFLCFTKSHPIDYGYFILQIQAQHSPRTALRLL